MPTPIDDPSSCLIEKIHQRTARIAIIGMGYVGLPLALAFCRAGFFVMGIEQDPERIHRLRFGLSPFAHIPSTDVAEWVDTGRLSIVDRRHEGSEPAKAQADVYILCVPTPVRTQPGASFPVPDMRPVESAVDDVAKMMAHEPDRERLVILESTTYPGTTRELVFPPLWRVNPNVMVAYSPEREDPGNKDFHTETIPKLVAGITPTASAAAVALYRAAIGKVHPVPSLEVAEMAKLWENTFRMINIAAVHELRELCDGVELDVRDVIDAAATKPFGFMPFYPGPGVGGHCIPVDPLYLAWEAGRRNKSARLLKLAHKINEDQPKRVVEHLIAAMQGARKPLKDARVLLCGVTYKANTEDTRHSPSTEVLAWMRRLHVGENVGIDWVDPFAGAWGEQHDDANTESHLRRVHFEKEPYPAPCYDAAVVLVNHTAHPGASVRDSLAKMNVGCVVDACGALRKDILFPGSVVTC